MLECRMNTPIVPVPAPPTPLSIKKVVLFAVLGLLVLAGVVLAAWEDGRVDLFAGMGFKGYRRIQADRMAVASKGSKPNYPEAFRLYQVDAEKGDGEALRKIGEMYRDGRGVPQSDAKARESWNKAAASGDVGTLIWLAEKHRTGDGRALPVNHPEVIRLLRRAASQGDAAAQAKLARQLLSYVAEYQMKLDFDEVLSGRQREELLGLQRIALLLKANNDGTVEKLTRAELNDKVAAAIAELSDAIREKFQWEAYFWLSLSAASNDDSDLRATRDGVAAKLKEKQVERVQGLVAKWNRSDAPGNAESPFVMDEGPMLDAPTVNKQTLSALLQDLASKASKLPEPAPTPAVPAKVSESPSKAAEVIPAGPTVSGAQGSQQVQAVSPEASLGYAKAFYDVQLSWAIRRNVLLAAPQNFTPEGQIFFGQLALNYDRTLAEAEFALGRLTNLRRAAKLVHPELLSYSDRFSRIMLGRITFFKKLRDKCNEVAANPYQKPTWDVLINEFKRFEEVELSALDAAEAMTIKRLGDELSIQPPERNSLYESKYNAHVSTVVGRLARLSDAQIYSELVGGKLGGWTFEFGEFREGRRGNPEVGNLLSNKESAFVALPFTLSVVGNNSGSGRIFKLKLFYTVDSEGRLTLIGVKELE